MSHIVTRAAVAVLALAMSLPVSAASLEVSPGTFDFGWAPDNAKIDAQYTVRNNGGDMVPLTSVKPTCGCTATNFEPDGLASREEKVITLTFNTRGYANTPFKKHAKIRTDVKENELTVYLAGHVTKAANGLVPDSDGIAGFESGSPRKKAINIANKTAADVSLVVVQEPAAWAKIKIPSKAIAPGASGVVEISVDGALDAERSTSVTLAPSGATDTNRVTLAIRTGPPPPPYRAPAAPAAAKTPKPGASPSKQN